ncbi:pantoate--beta-alanine ligase [Paludibacteraceae bacterium OttesenSCG-928-F17]|nr:pantoate--beta-alanine ligase [Paludibacteraceae bacterium OttesenSCG-928-F17]
MKIIKTKTELQYLIGQLKATGKSVGFVPTMGALHDGHIALVRRCAAENDYCIVSVFVNPTQFNNASDLEKYPRTLTKDAELLEEAGCYLVFAPDAEEMYSNDELENTFEFDFGGLDKVMEGRFRPGHFNGVVQVVSKLFDLVKPERAYFGEKDFQQLAIIRRMVEVMNYPVEIVGCPIIREESGLAMSSRNQRLTEEQRKKAANIYRFLSESLNFAGSKSPEEVSAWVIDSINEIDGLEVEYFDIANAKTLQTIDRWNDNCIGCIAVYCGEVRLIDNIRYY